MSIKNSGFLFVHVPKTGGTSFRRSLETTVMAEQLFFDYGVSSPDTSDFIKKTIYKDNDYIGFFNVFTEKTSYLIGHNVSRYYPLFNPSHVYTILRDPVQQVMSNFEHFKRHHHYNGDIIDFLSKKNIHNLQRKTLGNILVPSMGGIGTTESHAFFLESFQKKTGLNFQTIVANSNPYKVGSSYELDQQTIKQIEICNQEDIRLYRYAQKLSEYQYKLLDDDFGFVNGGYSIVNNNINGWAFRASLDEAIDVMININDETIATVKSNNYRPGLKERNAPRKGYVGFHYPIKNKDINSLNIKCLVSRTQQPLLPFI